VTPTTDTNGPGRGCAQVDAENAPCQAMDGAGHLGHALQAGDYPGGLVLVCRRHQQQDASLNAARSCIGSVAIACATGRQLGEVVEGDVPDDFDDELGREFGGGVV
jgi:hypothetical protein